MITPTLASAARHLSLQMMDHMRIRTMIVAGDFPTAQTLLIDRVESLVRDYATEGMITGTEDDNLACNILNSSFGPATKIAIRTAALEVCEEFASAMRD